MKLRLRQLSLLNLVLKKQCMKKTIIFFSLLVLIGISSCHLLDKKDSNEISSLVDNVETIVDKYDNNVQSALDSKKFDYINIMAKSAMDSTNVRLNELKNLTVPSQEQELLMSAVNYVENLQNLISTQKLYSMIRDTTSIEVAEEMDAKNLNAINNVESTRLKYIENLNAVAKK